MTSNALGCRVPVLSLLLLAAPLGCAHFSDIDEFPGAYRQRLAEHPAWLTITSFENAPGAFPPAETSVVKRWTVQRTAKEEMLLRQDSSSSFVGLLDALHQGRSLTPQVSLSADVDPQVFFPFPGHALDRRRRMKADLYEFRDLSAQRGDDRFEIRINGGVGRVVFVPAPRDRRIAGAAPDLADVGVWTAPFGAEGEIYAHIRRLLTSVAPKDEQASMTLPKELTGGPFLHHDLASRRRIAVVIDKSFPEPLRGAALRAAATWNAAFGKELLVVEPKARQIDPSDCLSGRKLCLRWFGPPALALTGANGYTELAFDPTTGLVVGGIVSVVNDDVSPPFAPLPPADLARFRRLDRNWIAEAMLRYHAMNRIAHPEPAAYVEYLLLHEMGHFSGLGHNFYVSDATTPARPVSTIMSYPPFPVAHKATYVSAIDRTRLAMVYGRRRPVGDELAYCSTFQAMTPERNLQGYFTKAASCDIFTIGNPADWYLRIAERGNAGVFTAFPDLSHLSDEMQMLYLEVARQRRLPPLNVLTRLGLVLADASPGNAKTRARISAYLCDRRSERRRIEAQLQAFHGLALVCD